MVLLLSVHLLQFTVLYKEDLTKYDFSKLKYCTVAGEPLNPEVYNQFYKATGIKLMEGYGQTELTLTIGTFPGWNPSQVQWASRLQAMS